MRRKRIMAGLAALSLLLSGLPVTSAGAAELTGMNEAVEQEIEEELPAGDSVEDTVGDVDNAETDTPNGYGPQVIEGTNVEADTADDVVLEDTGEELPAETEEYIQPHGGMDTEELNSAGNAKAAGSNGIFYDGVTYLSARNVLAMDEETQEAYRALCDDIAAGKEAGLEMQDVVLAVDAEGDLYCSYYVPMRALETMQSEFLPDTEEALTPTTEAEKAEDVTPDESNDAQEEEQEDGPSDITDTTDEGTNKDEDGLSDGADITDEDDSSDVTDITDGYPKEDEDLSNGTDTTDAEAGEDLPDDTEDVEEEAEGGGILSGDTDTADAAIADEAVAAEQAEEPATIIEENFGMIAFPEEVTFEVAEPARVENTMDLGYGAVPSENPGTVQLYSVLPKDNYFQAQLTATQKKYYKAAAERLIAGYSWFDFQESLSPSVRDSVPVDVSHAVSALILEYPDKTDWMAKPGGFRSTVKYKAKAKKGTYTFTFDVSKYYNLNGELDTQANAKVQQVGAEAVAYAADNYPDAPVYGIVKYYDQWLCENGYYENIGAKAAPDESEKEIYYNCHSAYGILLNGYGVCESYSKAMARLLDAVGIPNIYAAGTAGGGGHTWNYIQMPDGKWYVQDSTWNDTADQSHTTSDGTYFLKRDTGEHHATGCIYADETTEFKFPDLSDSDYSYEKFGLDRSTCDLIPKETVTLSCTSNATGYWTSSNAKVAKVDKNGKVTAVAGGTAVITFAGQGLTASCAVNVDQVKAVKTADTKKTSDAVSLGIAETQKDEKDILLAVDMGASPHTAQWLLDQKKMMAPEVINSKPEVATATAMVTDNIITVHMQAQAAGTSNVTVKFGGKSVKVKVSVGQVITADMFDVTWPANVTGADGSRTAVYTGKAVKPTVKKKTDEAYKPVKFKVTYMNNTNVGTAKVVITGTGVYGGTIEYPFTITPVDITGADFTKALKSKPYNGGSNPPATTVKLNNKALKVNKDYEILYTGGGFNKETLDYVPVGSYTITIRGIGNYAGEVNTTQTYQVTQNTIAKVSVAGAGSVKHTGIVQNPYTVKIGKNVLPASDYTIVWYVGQGKTKRDTPMVTPPIAKGKYTAVVTVKGSNLTTTAKKKEIVKKFTIK
ncbi:MAG: hypothetical protein HDR09_14455 [Lachnospiraceae bacterium]|nr:hypothetical protein [Lachnospiraceae bacterium]